MPLSPAPRPFHGLRPEAVGYSASARCQLTDNQQKLIHRQTMLLFSFASDCREPFVHVFPLRIVLKVKIIEGHERPQFHTVDVLFNQRLRARNDVCGHRHQHRAFHRIGSPAVSKAGFMEGIRLFAAERRACTGPCLNAASFQDIGCCQWQLCFSSLQLRLSF